jgi:hypothetical protein
MRRMVALEVRPRSRHGDCSAIFLQQHIFRTPGIVFVEPDQLASRQILPLPVPRMQAMNPKTVAHA